MYKNIINILKVNNINYTEITHEISKTCDDSKVFREASWLKWLWSKNLIFHSKWNFFIIITHANKRINAKRFKKEFWSKNIRFATPKEIETQINWTIWCIPSFWFLNTTIPIFIDSDIFREEYFMFTPDDPTKTIRLKTWDLNVIFNTLDNPVKYFLWGEDTMDIIEE